MMPHPERATSEALGNVDGRVVMQSLIINSLVTEKGALINF
jgi:phosphoribosylformylglycinamidine synthase